MPFVTVSKYFRFMFICHVRIVNDCLLAVYFQDLLGRPNLAMFQHVLNVFSFWIVEWFHFF